MTALFSPNNHTGDMVTSFSAEDILQVIQLVVNMSNSQFLEKKVMDDLVPLLDEAYSSKKMISSVLAAVGCGIVALVLFIPFGLPAVGVFQFGLGGSSLAHVSAAIKCYQQNAKRDRGSQVLIDHIRFSKARDEFLLWLMINMIGWERAQQLSQQEKVELYEKLGVQADLLRERVYTKCGLKTAWEELSDATRNLLSSCKTLAQ
ncbi:hypothetical protein N7528_009770 [Penicillium herquei]|nr:hypothetical protein N7528_009770 [Penicillium herquei]